LRTAPGRHINARASPERSAAAVTITWEQIEARKKRLGELARGLVRETLRIEEADDPFHFVERWAYCKALRQAIAGCETARVVLARAARRNAMGGA